MRPHFQSQRLQSMHQHLTPLVERRLRVMRMVDSKRSIPTHYDDYDVFASPLSDFKQKVEAAGLEDRVHYLGRGETYRFTPSPKASHRDSNDSYNKSGDDPATTGQISAHEAHDIRVMGP